VELLEAGMTVSEALSITIAGLGVGAMYAVILSGILIAYRASKIMNFAHGQYGMLAAFGSYYLFAMHGFPVWAGVVVGLAAAATVSWAVEVAFLRWVPSEYVGSDLLVTLGVLLALTTFAEHVFGTQTYEYLNILTRQHVVVGKVFINGNDLFVIGLALVLFGLMYLVLTRTGAGTSLRAVSENPGIARTVGVNVEAVRSRAWLVAGLLAGTAGVLAASRLAVDAYWMTLLLIKAFVAGMIGGLDRLVAPLVAALALGVYENWAAFVAGAQYQDPAVFVLVILVLAFAPSRFLEERHEARA
jgi:branched-chain amino acid transport system permease protein